MANGYYLPEKDMCLLHSDPWTTIKNFFDGCNERFPKIRVLFEDGTIITARPNVKT